MEGPKRGGQYAGGVGKAAKRIVNGCRRSHLQGEKKNQNKKKKKKKKENTKILPTPQQKTPTHQKKPKKKKNQKKNKETKKTQPQTTPKPKSLGGDWDEIGMGLPVLGIGSKKGVRNYKWGKKS